MLFEEGNNKSFTHLLQKPEDWLWNQNILMKILIIP
jgi:hypothetical protein